MGALFAQPESNKSEPKSVEKNETKSNTTQQTDTQPRDWSKYAPKIDLTINLRQHKINNQIITCPHMIEQDESNPLSCPIYKSMKKYYQFTNEHLDHITEFNHMKKTRVEQVEECKYGRQCKTFKRILDNGFAIADQCHMQLYRHPPRNKIELKQSNANMYSFAFLKNMNNEKRTPLIDLYEPTNDENTKYWNNTDGWLQPLIQEIKANGCESVMTMPETGDSLMSAVEDKMKHMRHIQLGCPLNKAEMLAIILYTGTKCYTLLCKTQRNGDYKTWKWLDLCLYNAIDKIWRREKGSYKLYSGLANVRLQEKTIHNGFFITYTSTTWRKEVALSFIYQYGDSGMLIEMDEAFRNNTFNRCCDVSWISRFPDECEVLMARGGQFLDRWKTRFIDAAKGDLVKNPMEEMKHYDEYVDFKIARTIQPLYNPTTNDKAKYWDNDTGWYKALSEEVTTNGFDGRITAPEVIEKQYTGTYNEEMKLRKDQILAIKLFYDYTDLGHDFASSQRAQNYQKWKWLDLLLYSALWCLSKRQRKDYKIYYPLNRVKIGSEKDKTLIEKMYFSSYYSASPNINVAVMFANNEGLIIELSCKYQRKSSVVCGFVSPYTMYPGESEYVLARSCNITHGAWRADVVDEKKFAKHRGMIQIIKLQDYGYLT
eukprot:9346_1